MTPEDVDLTLGPDIPHTKKVRAGGGSGGGPNNGVTATSEEEIKFGVDGEGIDTMKMAERSEMRGNGGEGRTRGSAESPCSAQGPST